MAVVVSGHQDKAAATIPGGVLPEPNAGLPEAACSVCIRHVEQRLRAAHLLGFLQIIRTREKKVQPALDEDDSVKEFTTKTGGE